MSITKRTYQHGEIEVIWQPGLCTHSAICFKGLPSVFDPRRKPWIEMDKGETEAIINQVNKCPSGALSFSLIEKK